MNKDLIEQVLSVLNDLGVSDERIGPAPLPYRHLR